MLLPAYFWQMEYRFYWCCRSCLAGLFFFMAIHATAQAPLQADFQNIPLSEAFRTLEKTGGITISYDPGLVKNIRVTASFTNKNPQEAFSILLQHTPLEAAVVRERHVLILKRDEAPSSLTLCAKLLDADSREALPYASIFSIKAGAGAQSNAEGQFQLSSNSELAPQDTLLIRMLGYRSLSVPASRLLNDNCPSILMRPISRELVEITITDRALEALELPAASRITEVRPERPGLVPSLGEPDPFRMVQVLPGVAADGDKADELLVRGGNTDQNLVLWEGIPIYHTGHLFGLVSALNPYVVDRVNVWKGNFSADQGGRVSSLIDMRTDPTPLERPSFAVGVNLVSTYFSLETPLFRRKGGLLFAGRHAFSGVLQSSGYQKLFGFATQDSRIKSEFETQQNDSLLQKAFRIFPYSTFSDGNLKLWLRPNARTLLDLNVYLGYDVLRYRRELDLRQFGTYLAAADTVNIVNFGMSAHVHRDWTENYSSEWRFAVSNYKSTYDFTGTTNPDVPQQYYQHQDNTLGEGVLQFDNNWRFSRRHHLQFGVQIIKTGNFFLDSLQNKPDPNASRRLQIDLPSNQSALYGIWRLGDSAHWYLEAGLRHVTFNYTTQSYWEPRLSAQWQAGKHLRLKAFAGVFHQFMRRAYVPNILGLNNRAWVTADDNLQLPVLESRQVSLGFTFEKKGWLLDAEVYGKVLEPVTGVDLRFNGTPDLSLWAARGTENVGGLELLLRKRWGRYTQVLAYTNSRADMQFDSLNQGNVFPSDFDQRQAINWTHNLGFKHWSFSLSWNYHSGRPYTPPTGVNTQTRPDGTVATSVAYGPRNSARLPDYSRLDSSIQYHFGEKHLTGTLGLSVFNLLNHANLQQREFFVQTLYDANGDPETYTTGTIERGLLGRMPNIFLLLRW
jgi:hypothetical protein